MNWWDGGIIHYSNTYIFTLYTHIPHPLSTCNFSDRYDYYFSYIVTWYKFKISTRDKSIATDYLNRFISGAYFKLVSCYYVRKVIIIFVRKTTGRKRMGNIHTYTHTYTHTHTCTHIFIQYIFEYKHTHTYTHTVYIYIWWSFN